MNLRRDGIYFNGYDDEPGWYNGNDGRLQADDEYVMDGDADVCGPPGGFVGPTRRRME